MASAVELAILLIEDDPGDAEYLQEILQDQRDRCVRIDWVKSIEEAQSVASKKKHDIILLDLFLVGSAGFDTFDRARAVFPNHPIVVLTGLDDQELALRMVRAEAEDYILKSSLDGTALVNTLTYALERFVLRRQLASSRQGFMNLLSSNSDGIVVLDDKRKIIYANPAAAKMFQQSSKNLVGTPFGLPVATAGPTEVDLVRKDEELIVVEMRATETDWQGRAANLVILHDVTDRRRAETERENLIAKLKEALAQVKRLSGLLPICANCKKVRDDQGYWQAVDQYIDEHSEAQISHSTCPECLRKLYPDLYPDEE